MPSLPQWLPRAAASEPVPGSSLPANAFYPRVKDPNAPNYRLQIASRCIYERQLPGGSYITAHIERLQSGYYDSPTIHENCILNVRFVAIRFTFHEASTERRFRAARIRLSIHDESSQPTGIPLPPQLDHPSNDYSPTERPRMKPKFLKYAPHLLYGAMSPENLDWNFNLAGSLGVAQAPVSASINPSGGIKSSYKIYKMMKIQGSLRTNSSWFGKHYDVEDGELVWTLEENQLQKSGLPREFTFVMMLTKGDSANDIRFEIDIEPEVAFGVIKFPKWYVHFLKYIPLFKEPLDLDKDVGQRFAPCDPYLGFNFASLMSTFDDFVTLPGTLYTTQDWSVTQDDSSTTANKKAGNQTHPAALITQSPTTLTEDSKPTPGNTLHLRIHLDQSTRGQSTSTTHSRSETAPRSQRSPAPAGTVTGIPSPPPNSKAESSQKPTSTGKATRPNRRLTLTGVTTTPTPPKYRVPKITPLQTHFEERHSPPAETKKPTVAPPKQEYEYSFPEPIEDIDTSDSQLTAPSIHHRHTKSTSTTSSMAATGVKPTISTEERPTGHTLRRSHSRTGLRKASLHSEPEDEEAIAAAMDMLSGSPPPPAPAPPSSAPPASMIPSDDLVLATPRTRAALADRLEVELAEKARIERRNGGSNIESSRRSGSSAGTELDTGNVTSRSREREKNREKRYSMPVTSTGIGYSSAGTAFPEYIQDSRNGDARRSGSVGGVSRSNENSQSRGNGRSSLMIPVGSKRDSGLGIGVATSDPEIGTSRSKTQTTSSRWDGGSGGHSGHGYAE